MSDGTDEILAGRAQQGCRASFEDLIERHYDRIHRLAWRWSGSETTAEDVAQDVCVKLASAIRNFRGEARFSTWLHRITYTTTLDHIRRTQRTVAVEPSEIVSLVDRMTLQPFEVSDAAQEIWDRVRALPEKQRDAILLVYGEELSHARAADVNWIFGSFKETG